MVFGFERAGVRRGPSSAQPSRTFGIGSGCACSQWLEERSAAALVSNAYVTKPYERSLVTSNATHRSNRSVVGHSRSKAKYYDRPMPVRDLALLMGHDIKTHQKHYGQWTTNKDAKESVRRVVKELIGASEK